MVFFVLGFFFVLFCLHFKVCSFFSIFQDNKSNNLQWYLGIAQKFKFRYFLKHLILLFSLHHILFSILWSEILSILWSHVSFQRVVNTPLFIAPPYSSTQLYLFGVLGSLSSCIPSPSRTAFLLFHWVGYFENSCIRWQVFLELYAFTPCLPWWCTSGQEIGEFSIGFLVSGG